jgi:hypothetical protein
VKLKSLAIASVGAVILLIATVVYEHLRYRRLVQLQATSIAAIAGSVGRLSSVLNELDTGASSRGHALEVRKSVTQLSLVLVSNQVDIANLDADSFSGLCSLVANAEKIFPPSGGAALEDVVNSLLVRQLGALREGIHAESAARASRPGDQHECALR